MRSYGRIVIILSLWCLPVLSNFLKEKIEQVSDLNCELFQFDGLSRLIVDHEAFAGVLLEVDNMYSTYVYMKPNENRTRYSVEVIKRYKFVNRFMCSYALSAHAYVKLVKQVMEFGDDSARRQNGRVTEVKNQQIKHLFDISVAFLGNVSRTLAILYGLEAPMPKWTIVAGMIAYEVHRNSKPDPVSVKSTVFSHMCRSVDLFAEEIGQVNESCGVFLDDAYAADGLLDYDTMVDVLNARADEMDKAHKLGVLKYGS